MPCECTDRLRVIAEALQAEIDSVRGSSALAGLGPDLTPAAGYEIQQQCRAIRIGRGEKLVGYKVGCTSAKVQEAFGIAGPIHGRLWKAEQVEANPGGRPPVAISAASFVGLAIEGELAVSLVSTEGPAAEWIVDYFPVIELHHGEFQCDFAVRAGEFIAKNGIHAGVQACV